MRDPVPDIREIITDRKEAGGLPSSTFLNLAPEKQEKLLSAAVREFTERPYNEASINRIVREAGIPRGSFYMYFRDKEDLFHYLMEESINEMLMVFEEVLRSQGGDIFAALPAMYDHLQSRRSADRSLGGMGMMSAIVNRNDGLQKGGLLEFLDPDRILKRMEGCVNPDLLDLREPYKTPCRLVLLEQHTMAEAARLCGRPEKTVNAQIYRAKKMLVQQIREQQEGRSVHGTV